MTIKFEDMEHDVKQSALRVIEQQFSQLAIDGPGYEAVAKAVVSTVRAAFQSLYEQDCRNEIKISVSGVSDRYYTEVFKRPGSLLRGE